MVKFVKGSKVISQSFFHPLITRIAANSTVRFCFMLKKSLQLICIVLNIQFNLRCWVLYLVGRYLLIYFSKVPWPGDNEVTFSVFQSSCHTCYYQSNHSNLKAIPLSALLVQGNNKRICQLYLHTTSLMLNVKQESYEYKLFKSFGLTQRENQTKVYRLRGGCSNR